MEMATYSEAGRPMVLLAVEGGQALPGTVWREGPVVDGLPTIEIHQPGGAFGAMPVRSARTAAELQAFLRRHGAAQLPPYQPGDAPLEHAGPRP